MRAAAEHRPAVAVLDVSMPGLDGYEVTRRLRADPATAATRILLLSARVAPADRERGVAAGADDRLDKPFSPTELARRVGELLGWLTRRPSSGGRRRRPWSARS